MQICFSKEALERTTSEQIYRLINMTNSTRIDVSVDFSLPDGYIYVIMYGYKQQTIHGGISPEGVMST